MRVLRQGSKENGLLGQSLLRKKISKGSDTFMSMRYYIVYASLCVLLAAFFPAMLAAKREKSFSKWYVYSVLLFPIALVHTFLLKKPRHYVNVFFHDKENPSKIKKKTFRTVPTAQKKIVVTPSYIYKVFLSKLLFGAFVGIVLFALYRAFVYDTRTLHCFCGFVLGFSFSGGNVPFFTIPHDCR